MDTTSLPQPRRQARTAAAPESRASMIPVDWNDILKVRDQWNNRWRREVISAAVGLYKDTNMLVPAQPLQTGTVLSV